MAPENEGIDTQMPAPASYTVMMARIHAAGLATINKYGTAHPQGYRGYRASPGGSYVVQSGADWYQHGRDMLARNESEWQRDYALVAADLETFMQCTEFAALEDYFSFIANASDGTYPQAQRVASALARACGDRIRGRDTPLARMRPVGSLGQPYDHERG